MKHIYWIIIILDKVPFMGIHVLAPYMVLVAFQGPLVNETLYWIIR